MGNDLLLIRRRGSGRHHLTLRAEDHAEVHAGDQEEAVCQPLREFGAVPSLHRLKRKGRFIESKPVCHHPSESIEMRENQI